MCLLSFHDDVRQTVIKVLLDKESRVWQRSVCSSSIQRCDIAEENLISVINSGSRRRPPSSVTVGADVAQFPPPFLSQWKISIMLGGCLHLRRTYHMRRTATSLSDYFTRNSPRISLNKSSSHTDTGKLLRFWVSIIRKRGNVLQLCF